MDLLPPEILQHTLFFVDKVCTLNSLKRTNKYYYSNVQLRYCKHDNNMLILMKLLPDKGWNLYSVSANPNITWEIVCDNPQIEWDYDGLSINPNITWDIVCANPDKPWNYDRLSANPNITWEIVRNNPGKKWGYFGLSSHPNITWEIVMNNLDKKWDYNMMSTNTFGKI